MNGRSVDFGNEECQQLRLEKRIEAEDKKKLPGTIVDFYFHDDALYITPPCQGGSNPIRLIPQNAAQERMTDRIQRHQKSVLLQIQNIFDDTVFLGIYFFPMIQELPSDPGMVISLTQPFAMEWRKMTGGKGELRQFMERTFILGQDICFLLLPGKEGSHAQLLGEGWSCEVAYNAAERAAQAVTLRRRASKRDIRGKIMLCRGKITFADGIQQTKEEVTRIYDREKESTDLFETVWQSYNEASLKAAYEEADRVGAMEYAVLSRGRVMQLRMKRDLEPYRDTTFLNSSQGYAVCAKEKYQRALQLAKEKWHHDGGAASVSEVLSLLDRERGAVSFVGERARWDAKSRSLKIEQLEDKIAEVPGEGYIFASLYGTAKMHERREKAYRVIQNLEAPLPSLKTIITSGYSAEKGTGKYYRPTSDTLLKKIFGSRKIHFTESQRAAIDKAINTQDIAIIQGPPGTGKTTVIRAIVERLNDIYRDKLKILIASTQHDAVDNAIAGMKCGGLPPTRMGGRYGQAGESNTYLEDWIREIDRKCKEYLQTEPEDSGREAFRYAVSLLYKLEMALSAKQVSEACANLKAIYQALYEMHFDNEILNDIMSAWEEMNHLAARRAESARRQQNPKLLKMLHEQRTDKESFLAGGRKQLRDLFFNMEDEFDIPEVWEKLRRVRRAEDCPNLEDLLAILARDLADLERKISGADDDEGEQMQDEEAAKAASLVPEIQNALDEYAHRHLTTVYDVVWEFRNKLSNPENVAQLLEKYTRVRAATCQQAALRGPLGVGDSIGSRAYDVVIVDEAARSNPLDLLIPMSMGGKIILVGDQRQLPHMLEDDVVAAVLEKYKDDPAAREKRHQALKQSLFSRLYDNLLKINGTKQIVMLQEQYRMHPIIGQFVSDAFYEGKIRSPLPSEERAQTLGMYGGANVAWLDVPMEAGREETAGASKLRSAEANRVMQELVDILTANDAYTVGIITFYRAQAERLQEQLDFLPKEQRQRVRTGTVDAFQGKEFDVVLLSTVRSNREHSVGFLASENRLCVAFSRAKRLLVVVGDSSTVARIPAFRQFHALCVKEGYYA